MDDIEILGDAGWTLVLVHGIQGTRDTWRPVVQALAGEARVVLPHLRGRGRAPRPDDPDAYDLDGYADDLVRIIAQTVGDAPYLLGGWSLGVSVTLQALARPAAFPRPAGVLLVSGTPCLAKARWFDRLAPADDPVLLNEIAARRQRLGLQQHADDRAVAATWAAIRHTDQRPLLPSLHLQAAVLHGSADDDCPLEHGRWLAEGLRAPLQVLEGVGHGVPGAAPQHVAGALRALRPSFPFPR